MRINLSVFHFIILVFILFTSCTENRKEPNFSSSNNNNIPEATPLTFKILGTIPHDTTAFTQGLILSNGALIEGTGLLKQTRINKIDTNSSKTEILKKNYEDDIFGEGITIFNDNLIQLTYLNKKIYKFSLTDLDKPLSTHSWSKEGWGLTNDSTSLILSDGSSTLFYLNPKDMTIQKELIIQDNYGKVDSLNELEFVEGFIFANKWGSDYIYKIDPKNGYVVGKISFEGIIQQYDKNFQPNPEKVLNGIAYDQGNKIMFVTGKNWPLIFKIKLDQ